MYKSGQISIVIITYNRPGDMLELVQNISMLKSKEILKEVVIVNNCSTESYAEIEAFIKSHPALPFKYLIAEKNLGVSAGRNFAIDQATAPILVFLDDDALFQDNHALEHIVTVFDENNKTSVGVVAFKVLYHSTMQLQQTAFPHKQFEERKNKSHFSTYYFAGCAHAVKKEVFEDVGKYPEEFFYGMEEYDLSYRILNAGYSIVYDNRVVVLHKESPEGRLTKKTKLRGMWVNKSIVSWKYLPGKYFYTTALMWSVYYLKKTGFDLAGWLQGWKEIFKSRSLYKKNMLQREALEYLGKVKARLWY